MSAAAIAPLRIGVIGAGRIGRMHASLLAHNVPGAAVAAVYDASEQPARDLAGELGIPVMASVEELLLSDVDAVAICSSTDSHAELVVAGAQAGKAVFCEKPISLDLEHVDRALAAVEAAGSAFQIGFNRRFDPAHAAVREAVASGRIGEPHVVRISSRDPAPPPRGYVSRSGGLFLDMTIHDFDMARFLTGSEVVEVFARGTVRIDDALQDFDDIDTALITLVHSDGCLTAIDNSRQASYGFDQRVEVFGSKGMAASENPLADTSVIQTAQGTHRRALPYFFLERYVPSYVRAWEAFVEAVRTGRSAISTADARAPTVIAMAAQQSLREGRPVKVMERAESAA